MFNYVSNINMYKNKKLCIKVYLSLSYESLSENRRRAQFKRKDFVTTVGTDNVIKI